MSLSSNQFKHIIMSSNIDTLQTTITILLGSMQDKENEKNIVLVINSLLSSNKTRSKGLELINAVIAHCSLDVLMENVMFWINTCVVNQNGQDPIREIKLKTIEKIIKRSASAESFNKKFIQEYLADTVKACLTHHSNTEKVTCLKCLSQCMDKYPSSLNNYREKIEIFLTKFLDSPFKNEVKDAAIAFHYWSQTGSAGVNAINYVNNFRNNFTKLCATVHGLFDTLFENIHEMSSFEKIDFDTFKFSGLQPNIDSQKFSEITSSRIINCLIFIKTTIMKRFPVEKQITPKYVVDIIIRGLSVHVCLAEGNILDSRQVFLLKEIQLEIFQLLRVFITGHCSSVLPFSNILMKSLLNSLKRANNCLCFSSDSSYKVFAYKSVISLMPNVEDHSRLQETLIPLLLEDIRPSKRKILLNPDLKKQGCTPNHFDGVSNRTFDDKNSSAKEDVCAIALEVLKYFLTECPITVNQPLLQEVMSFVVRTLTGLHINKVDPPYASTICEIKLYQVLISFFKQECKNIELPIHLVINLLHKGTESHIYKVAQTSLEGLELIEKISHPLCSSLCIDDSKSQSCQNFKERKQELCENREINILSNILITESIEEISDEAKEVESYPKESVEEANSFVISESVNNVNDERVVEINLTDVREENKETNADILTSISTGDSEISECSNEPPKKKQKQDEVNALEDMFESFQDVVQ